jgi:hypothetical protein
MIQPPGVGRLLAGRYRLVAPIARGGMAEVWEGEDGVLSRPVAVKVLQAHLAADAVFLERFRREAVTAARLAHPSIVATFDTGYDQGTAFIVMELIRGRNLRQWLDVYGRMEPAMAVAVAAQVADALAYAHQAGLIHRDIKPANILLFEENWSSVRVKVTDFGIAKAGLGGGDLTRTGMVLGTPKYLSPEQIRGRDPDPRADLYSLGVVLYEMLVGAPPFVADNDMATALAHLSERVPKPSASVRGLPHGLDRVIADLLAKSPDRRIPTGEELRRRLDALGLVPPAPGAPGWARSRRRAGGATPAGRPADRGRPGPPGAPAGSGMFGGALGPTATPVTPAASALAGPPARNGSPWPPPGVDATADRASAGNGPRPGLRDSGLPGWGLPGSGGPGPGPASPVPSASLPPGSLPPGSLPSCPPDQAPAHPLGPPPSRPAASAGTASGQPAPPATVSRVALPTLGPIGPASTQVLFGPGADGTARPDSGSTTILPRSSRRASAGRRTSVVVAGLVLAGAAAVAGLLATSDRPGSGSKTPAGSPVGPSRAVPITSVSVFMDNSRPPDNPTRTVYTYEPGATQAWTTDLYGNSHFGNLYDGIGLEIALQTSARLGSLQVTSTTQGWSGSAYVSTAEVASGQPIAAWGSPTSSLSDINGDATFSLGDRHGRFVLLWITNLGPADQASVAHLAVTS